MAKLLQLVTLLVASAAALKSPGKAPQPMAKQPTANALAVRGGFAMEKATSSAAS